MHDVTALLLEVDPFFPDATDEQHEGVVKIVEVAPVGFPVPAVRSVVAAHQIYRATILQEENRFLFGNFQAVVFIDSQLRLLR